MLGSLICLGSASSAIPASAETDTAIPLFLTTPDQVETSISTLKFRDGIPDQATADKVYDQLDTIVYFGPKKPDGVNDGNFFSRARQSLVRDPASVQSA